MIQSISKVNTTGFRLYLIRQGLAKRTVKQHLSRAETLIKKCQPFTCQNCELYLANRLENGISGSTINKYVQTIHKLRDFLGLKWDKTVSYVREQSKPRVLFTDDEIDAFISLETKDISGKITAKWSVFWKLLAYTGARPGEIRTLTVNDVDLSSKLIIIRKSKTDKGRTIPIAPVIFDDVSDYVGKLKGQYVFPNGESDCVSSTSYLKDFHKRKEMLGIKKDVKPYDFRHSFATRLLADGNANLFVVQDILGHTSPETTQVYFHNSLKAMRETLEKDPLMRSRLSPAKLAEDLVKIVKTLFSNDKRFKVSIQQKEGKLKIEITW